MLTPALKTAKIPFDKFPHQACANSEAMQRIAAPMVGGRVSATLLTLIVIPAFYGWVLEYRLKQSGQFTHLICRFCRLPSLPS